MLNDGTATHFNVSTGKNSAIGFSLCSIDVATNIEWKPVDELYGIDHYPIVLSLNSTKRENCAKPSRWLFNKADWKKYQEIITSKMKDYRIFLNTTLTSEKIDINIIIDKFNKTLLQAAMTVFPNPKVNHQIKTHRGGTMIATKLLKQLKKPLTDSREAEQKIIIEFKRLKAIAKRTVKSSKK